MSHIVIFLVIFVILYIHNVQPGTYTMLSSNINPTQDTIDCTCGIYLSGSFKKGSRDPPKDNMTLIYERPLTVPCTPFGYKLCVRQCLDVVLKNIRNSSEVICDALGRDCHREKAHLFTKNCKDKWISTNLSGSRHYCCKGGRPIKCSLH